MLADAERDAVQSPVRRAGLLLAYEAMYKAMVTMAVMCGFVPGPS